ncbi:LysM peptidoglycan-binding domain-containing protein [Gracilibacillus sp. S3-1-1]|uniref:LysM peptidoglycan-binding domain-containing protein n=1 Tax=Gracilibacillus pellucidus TaxID=3095368 RepID=A0ACC6M2E1_9BACI|nr:LysM peptidoglycan-binding domain-containing protein [Gracilibacillus sp. S3-1-1]MDX8045119.1 LysM peptidoglycan-binding domain-containing protein [Gracilibacillus sp. S3-1-1]
MRKFLVSVGFVATTFFIVLPVSAAEYEVVSGDNLWEIAQEHNTTVAELKEMNELDSDLIFPNQMLEIDKEITYTVERGDTLSRIASEHDVTVDDLKEWNNLETNLILVDEELTIKELNKSEIQQETNKASESKEQTEKQQTSEQTEKKEVKQEQSKEETPEASEPVVEKQDTASTESSSDHNGETLTVTATAYTADCAGCSGVTATGIDLNEDRNMKVIAVDPSVIPLGSRVYVEGYGEAIAGDTGGAIKGNKIDIHVPTASDATNWGVRTVDVTILD